MTEFDKLCAKLENKIKKAYEEGLTMEDAERLAGEFLYAQLQISEQLKVADLNARMRKTGTKAVKAAVFLQEATRTDKKPSDSMLAALVDKDTVVQGEQDQYDTAEVDKDEMERRYNIFREAHIWARGIAKGRFDG